MSPGADDRPAPHEGTEYSTYLLVDDLLRLQRPLTAGAHDEMLFIVIHQVYELWFRLILHELGRAVEVLHAGDLSEAIATLIRVHRVDELLVAQLAVLETMTPEGFLEFRDPLAPASGFQSRQFRAIEQTCAGPLLDAFHAAGRGAGLDLPDGADPAAGGRRLAALVALHRDHREPARGLLHRVAELLLDHDEAIARWRHRHVLMAAREIGERQGTGGSLGVAYLRSTVEQRFFPELWEVRSRL